MGVSNVREYCSLEMDDVLGVRMDMAMTLQLPRVGDVVIIV